ncbi:DUF5686 and carboxypeptidase regulatory-like domain-containing protein [Flavobacterium taihuense]|uniref:DUF5686 and carboxypeptidase regulatory-like domain-containing protein n=1 Tax=Flavobacterium taihuense TaxID=2857508 RepID=A0ABS6XZP2_9FLAO|nr:DUF5686 and carboxypeptidase regulatory-like domain-containing protein [Flavobacterium taihuense]MBW4361339.1 DUF5686 and carboxypeptidase regulatory-like domain-containing protein [Flavobacterium taihuense]
MKNAFLFLFLVTGLFCSAQIKGKITDEKGNPLPSVTIYEDNTYIGTTSNEQGFYELNTKKLGKHTIVFQFLGFKTQKSTIDIISFPYNLDIKLIEESFTLNEVVINPKDNPANHIIKNAIANKKANIEKTANYKADFYSRGIFRIKDAPKKILGRKLDMFDEVLDSTRSGILYLSETVSKITFQKPDKMKEIIIASKVSGNDSGFSFNNAASANFDFYDNYLDFDVNVVSPIADNAFSYYKYKLEGSFYNENNQQINKIKVTPKRPSEPVMEGYIYIIDDSWAIYAVDVNITGEQMQNPALNLLTLKQNFSYNSVTKIWVKNTQTIDFTFGMLGINISGRFTYVFSNFEFDPPFTKKTFTKEVLTFEENANKKEDEYWNTIRPIPLTIEESTDYIKKDSLQTKKKSQVYLDSIDRKHNRFHISDPITGYSYKNSFQKWSANYDGLLKGINFNTVQGWKINTGLSYTKNDREKGKYTRFGVDFDYGFSEDKFRSTGSFIHKFNNINKSEIQISGGSRVAQFNDEKPIKELLNSATTLFFKENLMKIYENNFISILYQREITNGIFLKAKMDYLENKPLFNTTDYTFLQKEKDYTSNNPLAPNDYTTPPFEKYNLVKANLEARINFDQNYITRPDGKYDFSNGNYPILTLGYEKGLAGSEKNYEFDHLKAKVFYESKLGNKGILSINAKGGKFFNADQISFVDYKHFNGNQTYIGFSESYLNVFNLMPYYANSTNDSYFELHAEHNDKGYIMNKIPLLNLLKSNLVLGYHLLAIPNRNPYTEYSVGLDNLGFGKLKIFRLDYVRSYQNGFQKDGIIVGLKIF